MGSLSQALASNRGERWGKCSHIDVSSTKHRPKGLKSGRVPIRSTPRLRLANKSRKKLEEMDVAYKANDRTKFDQLKAEYCKMSARLDEGEIVPALYFLFLQYPRMCGEPDWSQFGNKMEYHEARHPWYKRFMARVWG